MASFSTNHPELPHRTSDQTVIEVETIWPLSPRCKEKHKQGTQLLVSVQCSRIFNGRASSKARALLVL
jgi:transketolase C-terminal domain/subunit